MVRQSIERLHIRQIISGGIIAAACWVVLQLAGSRFAVAHLQHSNAVYGAFGLVLATIAWIYLQALVIMMSAEINVVGAQRLWPRSLLTPFTDDVELTDADRRAYALYAKIQQFKGFQQVEVSFTDHETR